MGAERTERDRAKGLTAVLVAALLALASCSGGSNAGEGGGAPESGDPAEQAAGAMGGEFNVLAYNVAGLPVEISKVRPDVNLPLISPLLNDYDVVLTQEDFDWWAPDGLAGSLDFVNYHARLRADTTHEHRNERHPGPDAVGLDLATRPLLQIGDGLGVLSRFELGEVVRVPWADCFGGIDTSDGGSADCLAMKGFLHTRITLADGIEVDIYNVHGEAGGTERDQELQAENYAAMAAYIAENSEGRAVIVGGDTNLHTSDHPDGSKGADTEIWDAFLAELDLLDACTELACDRPGDIDKVAFRGGGGVVLEATSHAFEDEVFVDAQGEPLSDHPALHVGFRWSAA
jgi:endonuclease/exonuclease/phosphatase family metal-dependent hydrolase